MIDQLTKGHCEYFSWKQQQEEEVGVRQLLPVGNVTFPRPCLSGVKGVFERREGKDREEEKFDGRERSRVPDPKIPYLDSEGSDMGQRYLFLAAAVLQICIHPWLGRPTIEPAASCLEIYSIAASIFDFGNHKRLKG